MRLRNRFILVGLGVILFLITTPILVLYARGFKIDFDKRQIIKTGTLIVKSDPDRAEIFLNDEKYDRITDANIRFLLPGDYVLRLEKDGYQSWTKRLSIKSQLVTWSTSAADAVTLFLVTPVMTEAITDPQLTNLLNPKPSPNATEISNLLQSINIQLPKFNSIKIIQEESQIYLILDDTLHLVNDKLEKIYAPVSSAYFDIETKNLVYSNQNEIYIYYPNSKESDLILRSVTPVLNPMLNKQAGYIFYQNENKIKAVELDSRDHRNIFTITDSQDQFTVSKDGKRLFTIGTNEIKYYIIR